MSSLPTVEQVLSLPASFDQLVEGEFIDVNGHMNIGDYFRLASVAPWRRLQELGVDDDYIAHRGLSFFTVEQSIRYASELRAGERFTVHSGFVSHGRRTLHGASFVVDREHDRVACSMETTYVHVSMESRRATAIPDDVAAALDADIASYGAGWLPAVADKLTLRPTAPPEDGTLPA